MQCTSCRATLQPGMTTCPSCGATIDTSPYEPYADTVPYVPYNPSEERAPTEVEERVSIPVGSSSPEPSTPQQSPDQSTDLVTPQETLSSGNPELLASEVVEALPTPQVPQQRRGFSASVTTLFILLVLLLAGGGGGLTYYTTVFHPAELHAQATAVVQNLQAEATVRAASINPQALYIQVTSDKPTITDPLNNANDSIWRTGGPACDVTAGTYHAIVSVKSNIAFCSAPETDFHDVAFQVQMTIVKGDMGGLTFRSTIDASNQLQTYFFGLDPAGGYHLFTLQSGPLHDGTSQATTGLNQPNLVTAIVHGNKFYFYVNKQFVTVVSDSTYASGGIGLFAFDVGSPTEVVFSNAQVWAL